MEQVKAFYQADLFVPGCFDKIFFLILGTILPFMDYATDYYNAGPDNNIEVKFKNRTTRITIIIVYRFINLADL